MVKSDRDGDIAGCVESLQALLVEDGGEECAKNASLMNNLAQALRLQQEDASDAEAVRLLTVAIALDASPDGRVKQNALCQRALLHEKRDEMDAARIDLEAGKRQASPSTLAHRHIFCLAAALGSAFAKKVHMRTRDALKFSLTLHAL